MIPQSAWAFPPADEADEHGIVGVGADLAPGTILAAYRQGLFPMPLDAERLAWWSPDPRAVIPLDGLRVTRSLRRSVRRFTVTVDRAFDAVIAACADPGRPHGWIDTPMREAYARLHRMGWVHSVETWTDDGQLAGGLYGVCIGGFFAGESMFHRRTDASKVALVHLVDRLVAGGGRLLDVQWSTPHLVSLGAVEIPRSEYLEELAEALVADADPFDWD